MSPIDIVVGLFVAAIPLVTVAWRWKIPYPVVLVIGGAALGFVPHLPVLHLDPKLIFLVMLPPLLYWEATTAPSLAFFRNGRAIGLLTVGLTIATMFAIAAIAHAFLPSMTWAVALVLGATIAPTDEAASLPILERLNIPRRVIAIVEGEALLNDAFSLVFYGVAIAAVVTGSFSLPSAGLQLVLSVAGSCAIGLGTGWLAITVWRAMHDPQLEAIVDIAVPYFAYASADALHMSGVLAVVIAGLYVNRKSIDVMHPSTRLRTAGFWSTLVFAVNALLYIIVGLQLHGILGAVSRYPVWVLIGLSAAVNAGLIGVRLAWIFIQGWLSGVRNWKNLLVASWAGLRGAISLAAALAVPATVASGGAFPFRDLIVFITFSSVLVTLVLGGFTLPPAIRLMRVPPDDSEQSETRKAIVGAATAAMRRLDDLQREGRVGGEQLDVLRGRYRMRISTYGAGDGKGRAMSDRLQEVERQLVEAERYALMEMRRRGEIDDDVVRGVQLQLDKDQTRYTSFGASMIPGSE